MTRTIAYRHLLMIPHPHRIDSATMIPRIRPCDDSSRPFLAATFHTAVEAMSSLRPNARNILPPPFSSVLHLLVHQLPPAHHHHRTPNRIRTTNQYCRPSNASASRHNLPLRPSPDHHHHLSQPPPTRSTAVPSSNGIRPRNPTRPVSHHHHTRPQTTKTRRQPLNA